MMTISRNTHIASFVFLFAFFAFFHISQAQGVEKGSLTFSPEFPTPGVKVDVVLQASGIDIDTALITWKLDGEVIKQSYSEDTFSFTSGPVGTKHTVSVSLKDGSGKSVYTEKTVLISDVDIVWEGRTYVPPFYRGRALHAPGADVAIQAIPTVVRNNGQLYEKNELSYLWYINNATEPSVRGIGKHAVTIKDNKPQQPLKLYLVVKDSSGETRVTKRFIIPNTEPTLMFYESSPFVGIRYDVAVGNTLSVFSTENNGGQMSIVAEPYYMSAASRNDTVLEYNWNIEGTESDSPGTLTLGSEGGGAGSNSLVLTIDNIEYWLQNARKEITVHFGSKSIWGYDN